MRFISLFFVRLASNNPHELKSLEMPYISDGSVETRVIDFNDPKKYESLVSGADVVIRSISPLVYSLAISHFFLSTSLLPAHMHNKVAEVCITARKALITASYLSPEMEKLNTLYASPIQNSILPSTYDFIIRATQRGVLILTEMGLDPGLDHLSAVSLIDKLKRNERNLVSFISMCGGLPAPEDAWDVPLKYKFSWRPEGVLIAALQNARFVLLGDVGIFFYFFSIC